MARHQQPGASRVLDELRFKTATAPGVRVAIGEPAHDIAGFRASHVEALEAKRIARLAARREGSITRYSDISLRALATTNLDHARDFVARELGALAARDDTTRAWRRRCAPTSMSTAAAAEPPNDSASTKTP